MKTARMRFAPLSSLCSYLLTCNMIAAIVVTSSPPINNYTVTSNDVTCVTMAAGFQFKVPYTGDTKNYTALVTVPSNPYTNGSCSDGNNILNVYFNESWSLSFTFTNTSNMYQMDAIQLNFVLNNVWFPNVSSASAGSKYSLTTKLPKGTNKALLGGSYQCQGQTTLALNRSISINIYDLQYRAFGKTNSSWFARNNVQKCILSNPPEPETNKAAAVSVGIALGVMIVLVVLLYILFTKVKGHKYGYT